MKLKSYIFLWVTLTALLPATVLGLFASYYIQSLYYQNAAEDIQRNLENISAEISRSLLADQDFIRKLPESQAIKQFLPVLNSARLGKRHPDYAQKLFELSQFLEQYQSVISLFDIFRIMDSHGNTLLKVHFGQQSITRYEGFEPYVLMDREIFLSEHNKLLSDLPVNNVSFIELPQTRDEVGLENNRVIPDIVIPLVLNEHRVGYLAVSIDGSHIDQLLELAARLYDGSLIIAEIDEENKLRNGQILYEEKKLLSFAQLKSIINKIQNRDGGLIWDAFQKQSYGSVAHPNADSHYYYMEHFPYPDSLTSWLMVSEVPDTAFTSVFERIRIGIWLLTGIAVLGSLFLAHFASRSISRPILHLAENLKTYADVSYRYGRKAVAVKTDIDEIKESSKSFVYMAQKLEQEQQERIKAENRLIQTAKLASLGQMAAGIGHEINNPLNNIRTLSRLIRRDIDKTINNSPHHIETIENHSEKHLYTMLDDIKSLDEEVTRASDIVQGVLSFARQTPEKEFTRVNVIELLKTTESLVAQEARRVKVQLTGMNTLYDFKSVMILGDAGKLQQALINILLNAIYANARKHFHAGNAQASQIELSLAVDKQKIILSIHDQGSGIEEAVKEKVFDPFFTTKEVGQGTGLGLSISLSIIQSHKGQLSITNAADSGAIVQIILPVCA